MPDGGGPEALNGLRLVAPRTRAVAHTTEADGSDLHEMINAGALGYVLKGSAAEDLLEILRLAGDRPVRGPDHRQEHELDRPVPSRAPPRVLIAHPEQAVLDALGEVLARGGDVELAATATSQEAAVLLARREGVSVALVDTAFPDIGAQFTRALVRAVPLLNVIRMSLMSDWTLLQGLVTNGITGCLVTLASADELRSAVRDAVRQAGRGHPSGGSAWSRMMLEGGLVVATTRRRDAWRERTCP